jgi:hypothetical protein
VIPEDRREQKREGELYVEMEHELGWKFTEIEVN